MARRRADPVSLTAPGVAQQDDEIDLPAEGAPGNRATRAAEALYRRRLLIRRASATRHPRIIRLRPIRAGAGRRRRRRGSGLRWAIPSTRSVRSRSSRPRRWPVRSSRCSTAGSPTRYSPQPMRWFGVRVAEIKQISAYSCRGMNGNPNSHISEHAFGNALDISRLRAGRWQARDGEGRLARHAGRAGLSARRAGLRPASSSTPCWRRAPTVHHRGPHPCRSDAPLQRTGDLPAGSGLRRCSWRQAQEMSVPMRHRASPETTGSLGGRRFGRTGTSPARGSTKKTSSTGI